MSAGFGDRLSNIEKRIEEIGNRLADEGKQIHGVHANGEMAAMSYFIDDDDDSGPALSNYLAKSEIGNMVGRFNMARKGKLPRGYNKQFNGFGDYLTQGMKANEDEFKKKNLDAWGQLKQLSKSAAAMNTIDQDSMGMLVLPEFAPKLTEILYDEQDMVGMTDKYTVKGNRMSFPKVPGGSRVTGSRNAGLVSYWLDEGDVILPTRAKMEATELKLKKLAVVVFFTEELLDDENFAIQAWTQKAVRSEMQFMISDSIVNGIGGGRPLGYINAPGTVVVAAEAGQLTKTLNAQNIIKMYSRMRANAKPSDYVWFLNKNVEPQLFNMVMPTGGIQTPVYLPPGGLSASPYASILGMKVMHSEFNPTLGTKGDIALVNMKGYVTINKGGINEMSSQHVEFLRQQLAVRFTMRIDGRPMQDTPTTPYQNAGDGSDTQGDFIVLATR